MTKATVVSTLKTLGRILNHYRARWTGPSETSNPIRRFDIAPLVNFSLASLSAGSHYYRRSTVRALSFSISICMLLLLPEKFGKMFWRLAVEMQLPTSFTHFD